MTKKQLNNLVKHLKKGDLSVFDEIYNDTYEYVYYVILSVARNASIADEISQETYIRMLEKIHLYKQSNFHAWLGTIARNLTLNYIKKNALPSIEDNHLNQRVFGDEDRSKEELLLLDMSKLLSEEELEIVLLHVLLKYPHKKISEMIDRPLGTVTWKYQQAIDKLRKGL